MSDCAVLVVGAGPVGLTMAAHLQRHGVDCRIIDRSPQPSQHSKALALWPRTLEVLDSIGLADTFVAAGRVIASGRVYGGQRLLIRFVFDLDDTRFPGPLLLAQCETERLLTEHLAGAGIVVERPVELTTFSDRGDHVQATLRHADGLEESMRCSWLLGCDGAHSAVRHGVGAQFVGHTHPNDWILADCRIDGPVPDDEPWLFWHARGLLALFPFAPGRWRVVADLGAANSAGGPAAPTPPTLAEVQAVVDERGPPGLRLSEPHWLSRFRIQERKVADYRCGRIFLAGDAAHIHSPAGGQGMNTGMQDAGNLAWKLAFVQHGLAAPSLLDSYTRERSPVGTIVLRNTARLTWVATMRNPLGRWLRNTVAGFLGRFAAYRRGVARALSELDIHYADSPLNSEDSGRRWARHSVRPGDRLPNIRMEIPAADGEQWLLSRLRGPCLHLLLLPAEDEPLGLQALADIADRMRVTHDKVIKTHIMFRGTAMPPAVAGEAFAWRDPAGLVRKRVGAQATALMLVRPDGYVSYRAQPALWEGLLAHLNRYLIGAPGPIYK